MISILLNLSRHVLWGLSLISIYFSYPFQMRFDIPAKEVMLIVVDL